MTPEEIIEEIRGLVFDPDTLQRFDRIVLLEDLLDKVSMYRISMKRYEKLFAHLQAEGKLTPFPQDWKEGEIHRTYQEAVEAEQAMFAVLTRFGRYPDIEPEEGTEHATG